MATTANTGLTDRKAVDEHHQQVGTITDVIRGEHDGEARLATVKTGLIGGERLIPLDGAYVADNGAVVVPFDRSQVKHAPRVPRDHVLTSEKRAEVTQHFHLTG
jgi:hypothetical protein